MKQKVYIAADSGDLGEVLAELSAELANAGSEFAGLALNLIKCPAQLIRIDDGGAVGATVTLLFKPSELLLDLLVALRASDFNGFIVKYPHLRPLSDGG